MQRQHFKLAQGYLNIDAQALIFTRSGNWQEAENAKERSPKQRAARLPRILIGSFLVIVGGLFFSLGKLRSASGVGSNVLALGLIGFGIYKMYNLLNDDFGPVFRIPFKKVIAMDHADGHLQIRFFDAHHAEMEHRQRMDDDAAACAELYFKASRA